MIFGNMKDIENFSFLEDRIKECFSYAGIHKLEEYEKGCHEIDGNRFYVNIVEYTTASKEERFWEAHREYLDIHLMLCGKERIDVNFIRNMKQKEYQPETDFLSMDGERNGFVILTPGDFLICYPEDGHRTAVSAAETEKVKKAIFKVRI